MRPPFAERKLGDHGESCDSYFQNVRPLAAAAICTQIDPVAMKRSGLNCRPIAGATPELPLSILEAP
jgi:hypothetical protein